MNQKEDSAIFYLSTFKAIAILEKLAENSLPVSLHALQYKLRGSFESSGELLRFLRHGEALGFIRKERQKDGFVFSITRKGRDALGKYIGLRKVVCFRN